MPGGDPAGDFDESVLPDEIRAKMKRIPTVVAILRQMDRVAYMVSAKLDASNAVEVFYALCSPYLTRLPDWKLRWDERPCASVRSESGRVVPVPQPSDYAAWFFLIMEGLTEAGVIFEESRVSYVGDARKRKIEAASDKRSELQVGLVGVGRSGSREPVSGAGASGDVGGRPLEGDGVRGGPDRVSVQRGGLVDGGGAQAGHQRPVDSHQAREAEGAANRAAKKQKLRDRLLALRQSPQAPPAA